MKRSKTTLRAPEYVAVEFPEEEEAEEMVFVLPGRKKAGFSKLPTIEEETYEEVIAENAADR
ncbi:hypothetical protein, partial [Acinetobacter baumannii]|uniref:hypothetical protein n=1 Tax=Acinetobacter baumannii TaxID=470 RepID=UPI00197AE1B4